MNDTRQTTQTPFKSEEVQRTDLTVGSRIVDVPDPGNEDNSPMYDFFPGLSRSRRMICRRADDVANASFVVGMLSNQSSDNGLCYGC